jgi:hypothetical protein
MCLAIIGFTALTSPSNAQQKTAKACREEWRANKADNQAKGITEKAYVAQCQTAGGATPPAPSPAGAASAPAAPASTAVAPTAKPTTAAKPAPAPSTAPTAANQFSTEAQAKVRCPSDTVVWVNLKSKIYHFAGTRDYGNTKSGAYMCERDTAATGARAAKSEKHP